MDDPYSAPESLLAFDIGSIHTRAMLFDVAGDRYHFVAQGRAQTTAGAPYFDIGEGCRLAVDELEKISGRVLVSKDDRLILPAQPDGSGVDALVSTLSAGEAVSAVAVGLLEEVSLESARRLIGSTYARLAESIGLNDRRPTEIQIDAIIQARPDVIVVAGGTEHGAARSITRVLEMVGLASYLIPAGKRPVLLYAGNQEVAARVKGQFETMQVVRTAPNIRPGFDHEDLGPAQNCLAEIVQKIRASRLAGMAELTNLSNGHSYPAAQAFGRMVRFLSKVYDSDKGVLGIDLGASSTVIAAAISGNLSLSVQTPLGMGAGLAGIAGRVDPAEISQWLPFQVSAEDVEDYLQQKIAASATLPESMEDQMLEEAVARVVIRRALSSLTPPPSG
ncbi:MAG TPA: glutamate mutase L, partial [Anaerolineaceae bacterium]